MIPYKLLGADFFCAIPFDSFGIETLALSTVEAVELEDYSRKTAVRLQRECPMQPALTSTDTLAATLRRFAYNRSNGTVELRSSNGAVSALVIVRGKIAGIEVPGWSPVETLVRRLREAERIPATLKLAVDTIDQLFGALQDEATLTVPIDEVFFRRAVREITLERILELDLPRVTVTGTSTLRGDISPQFSPALDPEDLRYDLEAFRNDASRFAKVFPPDTVVGTVKDSLGRLSPIEQVIVSALGSGCRVEDLYRRVLFSRLRFYEALLSLYDRRLIEVHPVQASSGEVDTVLNSLIDAAVEVEVIAQQLSTVVTIERTETALLQTSLTPRGIVALFRRLTGA